MLAYFLRSAASPEINVIFVGKQWEPLNFKIVFSLNTLTLHGFAVDSKERNGKLWLRIHASENKNMVTDLNSSMSNPGIRIAATLIGKAAKSGYLILHTKKMTLVNSNNYLCNMNT